MKTENFIEMRNVWFSYRRNGEAVNGISFNVKKGEIFGFLGPNGAGKTTTIRLISTIFKPDKGDLNVFGLDSTRNGLEIRKNIGVVLQRESYEYNMSVFSNMWVYGVMRGIKAEELKKRIKYLLRKLNLWNKKSHKMSDLSQGQRRRVQIARELLHIPKLLILDEPTIGLDPIGKRWLLDYFKKLAKSGTTIFYTTHILNEAEYLCDRIAIINHGKIVKIGRSEDLKRSIEKKKFFEVEVNSNQDKLVEILKSYNIRIESRNGKAIAISSNNIDDVISALNKFKSSAHNSIERISSRHVSLEDMFIELLGDEHE